METQINELAELITKVSGTAFDNQTSEQTTREVFVNPAIGSLGWDTFNPNEVSREFPVEGGRVDYCLKENNTNYALIEVKRLGENLKGHQEQLLGYAFKLGIRIAVLTDGSHWWFYLPLARATWEQRRFHLADFKEPDSQATARDIYQFLSKERLKSGQAVEDAQKKFDNQERDRQVQLALDQAWLEVLQDSSGLLPEILSEKVCEISNYTPNPQHIVQFLNDVAKRESEGRELPVKVKKPHSSKKKTEPVQKERQKPFRFHMVGIEKGAILTSKFDHSVTCSVVDDQKVSFEGKVTTLSGAALEVSKRFGFDWKTIAGGGYWCFRGETLNDMRERLKDRRN